MSESHVPTTLFDELTTLPRAEFQLHGLRLDGPGEVWGVFVGPAGLRVEVLGIRSPLGTWYPEAIVAHFDFGDGHIAVLDVDVRRGCVGLDGPDEYENLCTFELDPAQQEAFMAFGDHLVGLVGLRIHAAGR